MTGQNKADPERRCVLTGKSHKTEHLIRLVEGPEGQMVPDIALKLPGRGVWISADRDILEAALADGTCVKALARSLKKKVAKDALPENFLVLIEKLLAKRILNRLGLEKAAGRVITGYEKVQSHLKDGQSSVAMLFQARDASADGRAKMAALAVAVKVDVLELFDRDELSLALGRENVVHMVLLKGGVLHQFNADIIRLAGFRK